MLIGYPVLLTYNALVGLFPPRLETCSSTGSILLLLYLRAVWNTFFTLSPSFTSILSRATLQAAHERDTPPISVIPDIHCAFKHDIGPSVKH